MRFFSSSALANAPKLRFAASCSAAETMFGFLPPSPERDDDGGKTANALQSMLWRRHPALGPEIGQTPVIIWRLAWISPSQSAGRSSADADNDAVVTPPRLLPSQAPGS